MEILKFYNNTFQYNYYQYNYIRNKNIVLINIINESYIVLRHLISEGLSITEENSSYFKNQKQQALLL